jgi:hypothetical protein
MERISRDSEERVNLALLAHVNPVNRRAHVIDATPRHAAEHRAFGRALENAAIDDIRPVVIVAQLRRGCNETRSLQSSA